MLPMRIPRWTTGLMVPVLAASLLAGCAAQPAAEPGAGSARPQAARPAEAGAPAARALSGTIRIDGSSTVFPISEAVAEEFQKLHKDVRVTVGISGTGGGMKKFANGEIDIADASRPQKPAEAEAARARGLEGIQLPVAYDGISVVVNPQNTFVDCLTTAELKKIWDQGSQVRTWKDVRPEWPAEPLKLYGPGTDSGTFDYFTEHINGKEKQSRTDYTASEDDNVLVKGVSGDRNALGYFGYAYYEENRSSLKAVKVDGGKGCVAPSTGTINDGTYPISRQIYIYPEKNALRRPEVAEFVKFYLTSAPRLVPQVKYVPLPDRLYQEGLAKVEAALK